MAFKGFVFSGLMVFSLFAGAQSDSDVVEADEIKQQREAQLTVEESSLKNDDSQPSQTSGQSVERIEVTGSYVRRIDVEGPSPVVTIQKEDFEKAGVDTVSDYLRESAMFTGSSDSGNRDGYFRFRGQHAGSTLVLINGMRLPQLGGDQRGFYTGVEAIPTNVIERVEVVKDGSSALYGSDAMAGVMNFITKKDYDGAEYATRINVPEINAGIQQNHTLSFGKSYARGGWFASTQFVEQRGYTEQDAGNFYQDRSLVNGRSSENTVSFFDSATGGDGTEVDAPGSCPGDASGRDCDTDYRNVDYVRDSRQNIGTLVSGQYEVNSDITVSMVGMYNRRQRTERGRPRFINLGEQAGNERLLVSSLGSPTLQAAADGKSYVELKSLPMDEIGPRNIDILQNAYSAQAKVAGYYLDTWRWDISGSYAYTLEEQFHNNGLVTEAGVTNALQSGWNPLSVGPSNSGALNGAQIQGTEAYEASMSTVRMLTTGELLDMNDVYGTGGPVSVAVGVEAQYETTNDAHDEILIGQVANQNFFPNQGGSRSVNSMFTEFVLYPLNAVEVQLAGRMDSYSDFGETFNPKVSVGYRPSNKVLLRSSWGTNFKAPSVRNLIERDQVGYERLQFCDHSDKDGCKRNFAPVTRYRVDELRPERGVNYNFGTVIQPNRKWTFTIDQWNFEGSETFSRLSSGAYSNIYNGLLNRAPGSVDTKFNEIGVEFDRDADGNPINVRIPAVVNLGEKTIRGLDINVAFNSPIRLFGRVLRANANMEHTHMLLYEEQTAEVLEPFFRRDLEWKNTMSFGFSTKRHSYRWAARTLAGDTDTDASIRTHTEYDFNYNYDLPFWTAQLSFGVKNLLNTRPPVDRGRNFVDFTDGYNSYAFQALGRRYYVGYSHTF